ncbi:MAG TPA: VCBS repeat-containing protein [Pyrinomonadaceae bacterium]|nr:VCBS repeat-containing protein [Pyrinomonadaceae bacterium]
MILNNRFRPARLLVSFSLLIVATSFAAVSVYAQSATFARTDYAFLGNNQTLGDFNGDGMLDLAGTAGNGAAIMLGNGNGTFGAKVAYPAGGFAQDVASGDFNGDGKLDLIVTINDPEIGLALLAGNGDGSFNTPVNFPNTSHLDSPAVVATDLDNDGRLDVVVAHQIACYTAPCVVGRSITVLLGLGDGTFQLPWEMEVGTGMSRIVASDFNRDGLEDLAIAGDRSQVYVLFGVGNGTFLQQPTITLTPDTFGVDATDIDLADFNGDAVPDLVVAIALNGSRTAILLGNTDGTFRQPLIITEPGGRVPQYQVVGDFNRDGFQDVAISLGFGSNGLMEIINGNGDGTFRAPVLYQKPPAKSSVSGGLIVSGDFNRDGKPDIALPITGASASLAVLINSSGGVAIPPAIGSVTAAPSSVVGGDASEINVTLASGAVAPSGGYSLAVSSSNSSVVTVPATASIPAGSSSVRFNVTTRSVTANQNVTITVVNNQLGSRSVTLTVTPPPPPPSAITLSALTINPGAVTGGNSAQGTVILSATASAATVVNLASNNAAATLPASVTVMAGASSASFNINTTTVTAARSVAITATLNGITRTATLTVNAPPPPPPPPSTDTVRITRAEYDASKQKLRVEATSTGANATLQVFNTSSGQLIGTLSNNGGGRYSGQLNTPLNPRSITVRSSLGGTATGAVDSH